MQQREADCHVLHSTSEMLGWWWKENSLTELQPVEQKHQKSIWASVQNQTVKITRKD